ncbi:MAG: VRR-NUC domain-containing protein [Candidatus Dormibacteria bacterium]
MPDEIIGSKKKVCTFAEHAEHIKRWISICPACGAKLQLPPSRKEMKEIAKKLLAHETHIHKRVVKELRKRGCGVLDKGWPDLLVSRRKKLLLVKVKGPSDRVGQEQKRCHRLLRQAGLHVIVLHVDRGGNPVDWEGDFALSDLCEFLRKSYFIHLSELNHR